MAVLESQVSKPKKSRRALTPEARDEVCMNLAVNLAEQQLRDGTASAQVITHYLKLASYREKERLEREMLEEQNKLLKAKTAAIESSQKSEAMYADVLEAMKRYGGHFNSSQDEYDSY